VPVLAYLTSLISLLHGAEQKINRKEPKGKNFSTVRFILRPTYNLTTVL